MNVLSSSLLIALLIVISAFFSISEISLAASRKMKLAQMRDEGDERAELVLELLAQPGHFFTAVQIGVNAVAILAGVLGESVYSAAFTQFFARFFAAETALTLGSTGAFLAVTAAFILLADLIPKRIGMVVSEAAAVRIVRPIRFCVLCLRPFVWFFNGLANQAMNLLGLPAARINDVTTDDILAMASAGALTGVVAKQEQQLIENVFELEERTAPSSMTVRESIVWIDRLESEDSIKAKLLASPHAKFPVCIGHIDQVIGYVDSQDILSNVLRGESISLRGDGLLRNALILPETLSLAEILSQFKAAREDFALIINEYALVVGLITLNDITGALMGDHSVALDEEQIVQRDANTWLVDGVTAIGDLERVFGIEAFPDDDQYETIAGFMMYMLRKVPKRTDFVTHAGFKFEVVDIDNYKIDQLLVTRLGEAAPQ
ncbi:HlyC/CorC family transporter [Chitinibacter bivalviorum]|uniref:Polyamine export protein n=1 Tax=Chitinibacter bivalviorum TaxID=2739434 RepID=A0A7H9BK61_9NEIS|nr:hemolysin family protein [Chitinibacter bivalviorum]QLG89067.1 HlyC/CorC family transporter [Chitinibacter bivalviorum]